MRSISAWARRHQQLAISFIVLIKIALLFLAVYLGVQLNEQNIHIPYLVLIFTVAIMFAAIVLYPSQKNKHSFRNYSGRKLCDLILSIGGFISVLFITTNPQQIGTFSAIGVVQGFVVKPVLSESQGSLKILPIKKISHAERKVFRKEFFKQLKNYIKANPKSRKSTGSQILLITLTLIAACLALLLLAALVCNLSCSGDDTTAAIIAIAGAVGIIIGVVVIINKITGHKKKDKPIENKAADLN